MTRSLLAIAVLAAACELVTPPVGHTLAVGVWGGADAGLVVGDRAAHAHIGCTAGDVPGRIPLDSLGRFDVAGTYHIRLYPVAIGEPHPARFRGETDGRTVTLTVALTDTAVVLGPVRLRFGQEPAMVMCPICRHPAPR